MVPACAAWLVASSSATNHHQSSVILIIALLFAILFFPLKKWRRGSQSFVVVVDVSLVASLL